MPTARPPLLQAPEGDLGAAEPAEAGDRGPVPPPGQAAAPQPGPVPHGTPGWPQEEEQEQAEGGEAAQPAGAAAQGRGLQHRSVPSRPPREPGGWEAGTQPWESTPWLPFRGSREALAGAPVRRALGVGRPTWSSQPPLGSRAQVSLARLPPCRVLPGSAAASSGCLPGTCHLLKVGSRAAPFGGGGGCGVRRPPHSGPETK